MFERVGPTVARASSRPRTRCAYRRDLLVADSDRAAGIPSFGSKALWPVTFGPDLPTLRAMDWGGVRRRPAALGVNFQAAQARLANLTHGGWLSTASGGVYADGLAGLIRVGPFGDVPGASKLVKVSPEPVPRDDVVVLALRWEATGATGRLFPVLDADLTMRPAGAGHTLMRLDGAYRPPLGGVGAGLDRVVVGRAATATIRSLLARIADALVSPAPAAETAGQPASGQRPRLAVDPEKPGLIWVRLTRPDPGELAAVRRAVGREVLR